MSCYHRPDQPRAIVGRHHDDCPGDDCRGCQPCTETHCLCCGKNHAHAACPACIGHARGDLAAIVTMCGFPLVAEALNRGVNAEATMLLSPTADPQAWRWRATSALMGRVPAAYLEDCRDERHPTWVLGSWEQLWRDHLDQPTDLRLTIDRAADYLGRHLTDMGEVLDPPFDEFAKDIHGCRAHLESVLSEGDRDDPAGVGCFDCGGQLVRRMTDTGLDDKWTCRKCERRFTDPEYHLAVRAAIEGKAS